MNATEWAQRYVISASWTGRLEAISEPEIDIGPAGSQVVRAAANSLRIGSAWPILTYFDVALRMTKARWQKIRVPGAALSG